jgi:hypothetical protein
MAQKCRFPQAGQQAIDAIHRIGARKTKPQPPLLSRFFSTLKRRFLSKIICQGKLWTAIPRQREAAENASVLFFAGVKHVARFMDEVGKPAVFPPF